MSEWNTKNMADRDDIARVPSCALMNLYTPMNRALAMDLMVIK